MFQYIPMARPLSPRILAAGFGAYFVATFVGAWFFYAGLPSASYGPDASRWVYAISAIAAVNLMSVLSVIPVVRAGAWNPGTSSEIPKNSEAPARPPPAGELDKVGRDALDAQVHLEIVVTMRAGHPPALRAVVPHAAGTGVGEGFEHDGKR